VLQNKEKRKRLQSHTRKIKQIKKSNPPLSSEKESGGFFIFLLAGRTEREL